MSFEVTTAFVEDYRATVQQLLQQRDSRFAMAVTADSYTGKSAKPVDQIGAVAAQKRTSRHGDTPLISTPHDARWVFPQDYEWADMIDNADKLRMIIDPTSPYAINGASAMMRAKDDEIIDAFFGDSKTGEDGGTTTSFDTSNQQIAASSAGLTVAKLREAKKILLSNEVDTEFDPLYVGMTAKQHDDLLSETQAISLDFNDKPVLVDGMITRFMGFNFILSERLGVDGSSNRRLPAWAKSGMHLGQWQEIMTRVSERGDKSYSTQVYLCGTFGATRMEEGKVVEILCSEA